MARPTAKAEDHCGWVASIGLPIGAALIGWKIDPLRSFLNLTSKDSSDHRRSGSKEEVCM